MCRLSKNKFNWLYQKSVNDAMFFVFLLDKSSSSVNLFQWMHMFYFCKVIDKIIKCLFVKGKKRREKRGEEATKAMY